MTEGGQEQGEAPEGAVAPAERSVPRSRRWLVAGLCSAGLLALSLSSFLSSPELVRTSPEASSTLPLEPFGREALAPPASAAARGAGQPKAEGDQDGLPQFPPEAVASNTFQPEVAALALAAAASEARKCVPVEGAPVEGTTTGRVRVRYVPSGSVSDVSLLTDGLEGTPTANCVKMLFRRAAVPPFLGSPYVDVSQRFQLSTSGAPLP